MPRLLQFYAGRAIYFVGFVYTAAEIYMYCDIIIICRMLFVVYVTEILYDKFQCHPQK